MGFELSEKALLNAGGVGTTGLAVLCFASPKTVHDLWFTDKVQRNDAAVRWHGHALACSSAYAFGAASDSVTDAKGKKNMLKIAGCCWAGALGMFGYNVYKENMKRDGLIIGQAAAMATLTALQLYKGFKPEGKKKEKDAKPADTKPAAAKASGKK